MYSTFYQDKGRGYYNHTRPELTHYVPLQNKTVLDVGCGSGNFGLMLKELFNCSVWGIEPDETAAQEAKGKLDTVINDLYRPSAGIPAAQKFDCIFFNDVLEHMAQPEEALAMASTMLAKDGHVVASIPSIRFYPVILSLLRYKDFQYQNAGVMDKTHLRFFTAKSMVRMFEESGFCVKKIEGINRCDDFKYLNILNTLLFNRIDDMKYPQFAVVAQLK